ncbi:hypothetical protein SLA2020_421170 [Shorea laevis]
MLPVERKYRRSNGRRTVVGRQLEWTTLTNFQNGLVERPLERTPLELNFNFLNCSSRPPLRMAIGTELPGARPIE